MKPSEIILTTKSELRSTILNALTDFEQAKKESQPPKLFSINQVAKSLGKSHQTIKKYVLKGLIRSTKSGLIPEDAIEEYLKGH